MLGSNQRQSACKTGALPTELITYIFIGLTDENRTHNHQNHNLMLYQLSYRQHLVGSQGLAPCGSKTPDLQSGPLLVTVYLPEISSIVIFKGY